MSLAVMTWIEDKGRLEATYESGDTWCEVPKFKTHLKDDIPYKLWTVRQLTYIRSKHDLWV